MVSNHSGRRDRRPPGPAIHDSRPRRQPGDRRDPPSLRESDSGHRFPDRAANARRCLSQTDRPLDSRLTPMLRGLWNLTWLEIKIFLREPLGLFATIGVPVLVFVVAGRIVGGRPSASLAGGAAAG